MFYAKNVFCLYVFAFFLQFENKNQSCCKFILSNEIVVEKIKGSSSVK